MQGLSGGLFSKRGKIFSACGLHGGFAFSDAFYGQAFVGGGAYDGHAHRCGALHAHTRQNLYEAVNTAIESRSAVTDYLAQRISFGAECFAKIGDSTDRASELLAEKNSSRIDISETVCRKICGECRNRDFCCKSDENRIRAAFVPCEKLLLAKGFITVPELPRCIESCTKKLRSPSL